MRPIQIATFAAAFAALTACSNAEPLNHDFGASVRHNMMMHIIDPAPAHAGIGTPALRGPRATGVMDRYDKGTVTPLVIEKSERK